MKYENLEKAERKCADIDEVNRMLSCLAEKPLTIRLYKETVPYHIVSFSPDADPSQYPEMPIEPMAHFRTALIAHYTILLDKLHKELAEL